MLVQCKSCASQSLKTPDFVSIVVAGLRDSDKLLQGHAITCASALAVDDDFRKEVSAGSHRIDIFQTLPLTCSCGCSSSSRTACRT